MRGQVILAEAVGEAGGHVFEAGHFGFVRQAPAQGLDGDAQFLNGRLLERLIAPDLAQRDVAALLGRCRTARAEAARDHIS